MGKCVTNFHGINFSLTAATTIIPRVSIVHIIKNVFQHKMEYKNRIRGC
jgi:hypothetical protein